MSNEAKNRGKKAIVIGASMAGLLAARVLADHFDEVIILERDVFPGPGSNRKGVPQGKHTHVLLERGRQIMEKYLPGLTDELIQKGANKIKDAGLNISWFQNGQFNKSGASGIPGVGVSRPTLEGTVRAHVLKTPNISAKENCKVLGLLTTTDNTRVTGVRLIDYQKNEAEETLSADLVVDASGRGSRSPKWLEEMGFGKPKVEEVKVNLGYTSCFFRREAEHLSGKDGLVFLSTPPNKRIGVILAQDDNRWVVTLGGYLGDHVRAVYDEFQKVAKNLPGPYIYDVIKDAELLSGPVAYKFPANLRHYYEKLKRFPDGYLVFGDALCSFNPIYGQGMTVAAMEAETLGECLQKGEIKLARRFFKKASKVIDLSWDSAVGGDLSFSEVEGRRTPLIRFLNWYIGKLHIAAHHDAKVSTAFLRVINMISPAPSILKPGIVWRIIKGNLRGKKVRRGNNTEARNVAKQIKAEKVEYPFT